MRGKTIAVALVLLASIMVGCRNLTTDDPYVDEIERVIMEVQEYYFYDSAGSGENDGIPDHRNDTGEFSGECTDYAAEFSERYSGESYVICAPGGDYGILWTKLQGAFENGTIRIRPNGNLRFNREPGGVIEHDGNSKDHKFIIEKIDDEWTLETSYMNIENHAWNVLVTPDNRWFFLDASSERKKVLKEVNVPAWAK